MTRWLPSEIYPDPAIEILDKRFASYRLMNAGIERLASGTRWGEGPVWFGDCRSLFWSDIPNNRILRWDEASGRTSVFRSPSGFANGNTRDRSGRLVTCEHGGRRVTRTEYDGSITVLLDRWNGKRLNSPNDVVVKSDGSIWFTDPPFGLQTHYEGAVEAQELPACVYRIDPHSGQASVVADDVLGPNGLCFSPDERVLHVVESRGEPSRKIRSFDVVGDVRLGGSRVLIDAGPGTPDGMRCDVDGNLWVGWGMGDPALDGVMVFEPGGSPIGRIGLPERCANLCFGGRHRNRLFMACGHGLYAVFVNSQGAT
ncbi:SMP-30/gluconolactonase/LRE family protein [Lichenicoccus sp.]|uniref:SMP-30/gluconolactonase/LRE family protein n=1 Tax=Lichenicoccus sp. TaxID=2781899 RepID=UPI003D123D82